MLALIALRARSGDEDAFEELLHKFMPLIRKYARKYATDPNPQEDLISEGYIGLLYALKNWDASRPFSAGWVASNVRGKMLKYLRDHGYLVKMPRPSSISRKLLPAPFIASISEPIAVDEHGIPWTLEDMLKAPEELSDALDILDLEATIARLNARSQHVLRRRYWDKWHQRQIAEELGLSKMQVSRIQRAAEIALARALRPGARAQGYCR